MDIPEIGTNLEMWQILVTALLPAFISMVIRSEWSKSVKILVAIASSLVVGAGYTYFLEMWDPGDWITTSLIVLVISQAAYALFWQPTGLDKKIESATSK